MPYDERPLSATTGTPVMKISTENAVRKVHTHLFLVYDDLVPNITPALDPRFRPEKVCLLVAPDMRLYADRLARLLREAGLKVDEWAIDDPWDIQHLYERVLALLADRTDVDVALNASGGTRPMSLAAFEAFRYADKPIYYVHPENDHVVWLHPHEYGSFDLADRIRLSTFLASQDLQLVSAVRQGVNDNLQSLTSTLVRKVGHFSPALAILNWYAAAATERQGMRSPSLNLKHLQHPELNELLDLFSEQGLIQFNSQQQLVFADEASRFYVNGGWLEEHVFGVLSRLRHELTTIQDLARNVVIEWDDQGSPVKNELDVAFLANNRLFLVECKTKKFEKDPSADSDIASTLYKLNTLRDAFGGIQGKAMLVSYRSLKKAALQRAHELGIEVCAESRIPALESFVRKWVKTP